MAQPGISRFRQPGGALAVALILVAGCGTNSSSSGKPTSPIPVGVVYGVTGRTASVADSFNKGIQIAVDDIANHGGVLGQPLQTYLGDTAADPVDAVPGLRQVLLHHPAFLIGPTSIEFNALQPVIDQAQIPDFPDTPSTAFDTVADKWVFSMKGSDSQQGKASAYYAIQKGWTNCSLIFDNTEIAQSLIPALTSAYTKHGGTIVASVTLAAGQSSYRSEIVKAFAGNPQCVFTQLDATTAGTVFANARDLGHLNVPYIGSNVFRDPLYAKAIGPADDSKWVTATDSATPSSAAFDYFAGLYKAKYGLVPPSAAVIMYDSVIVAALAMTKAGTIDGKAWANDILTVADPPGTQCYTYATCVSLISAGTKINFEGASGPMDFDPMYHRVTNDWAIYQFDSAGKNLSVIATIPATALEAF